MAGYSTMPPPPINSLNVIQKSHASFSFTTSRLSHHPPTDIRSFWMVVEPANHLLQVDGGHMPPSTGQPFQGSAISTSLLTSAEPFAFIAGHLAVILHEDKVIAVECPPAGCAPAHGGRSHRDRQVLVHHLLSDALHSGR